ncbi:hypothetical protein [Frondihabitans cladoniiphilus]|uniref:DUF4234 domain-containing protein n=1 Tax=Frondihabitans cladoniiphilus TaxID=715785 RepID=A0ABP8VIE7_9MICO
MSDKQPYAGNPRVRQSDVYGGVPYLPPDRVEHYHDRGVEVLPTMSKVFRIVVTAIFVALAVVEFVAAVRAAVNLAALSANPGPDPHWSAAGTGLVAPIMLGLVFLIYPFVNLVRLRRAHASFRLGEVVSRRGAKRKTRGETT